MINLEQSDRQPHKQPRPFGAPDSADHPVHNPPYTTTGNYMNSHNAPGHERPRVQSGRHHALDRNILDYSESYNPHGQEPPLVTHHTGMAFLDDMSLLSPSHPSQTIQPDPQGQSFHPMLLNTGTSKNRISGSLDSVPMGLASPAIIPHPDYGAVASYVHTPTAFVSKGRSSGSGGGGDALPSRPLPQRTQSAGGRITSTPKLHRTRTGSAISSSSSLGSSAVVPPTTSALGIANSSFASSSSVISTAAGNPPNTGATTAIGTGSGVDMDEGISVSPSSSFSSSASKPRPNNHPRKAVAARVYECTFPGCNKAYTQLHNLKSHERTGHTPVQKPKPFLCIISGCTKAFSQRKSLALHIRASHKEYKFKPFKCAQPGCQKSYTQLHNLRTHEKTVHMLDLSKKRIRNPAPNTESTEENMIGVHEDDEASDNDKNKKSSNINNDKNINNATIDHVHQDEVVATSNSEGHSISNFSSRGYNCNSSNKGSFEQRMELNYRNINELGGYGARREAEGTYEDEGHEGNIKNGGYVND
ncbi:hypothetical protein BX616_004970 [Lobosporangium transversale]|nr:hypothetical protein BX616_004970 [Lobosporangium transversale]